MDVNYSLILAVREGNLERTRQLINSYGLSYSPGWSGGYNLLRDAVMYNHATVAKLLLSSGSRVNSKSIKPTDTPLHYAAGKGNIEIVKLLLDKGANIVARNKDGRTPIHCAILTKNIEVTELLLKHGADVNASDNDGRRPLHVAVEEERLRIVVQLIDYGAYIDCVCTSGWNEGYAPLHIAVQKGNKELVTLLLSRGANVDVKGDDSITPLHIAARKGYVSIAEDLLNHGACIHSLALVKGYTPLHFAAERGTTEKTIKLFLTRDSYIAAKTGHRTVVELLLERGAEVDSQDKDGNTALLLAVKKGSLSIVKDVLKFCPDINNRSNRSSLKIAVLGYSEIYKTILETLLAYGFIVNPEDASNRQLLHAAIEKGYLKIVGDLLKYGANVNMLDDSSFKEGFTPLHRAAKFKQDEVAKLLISYGADINAQDKSGETPTFYAIGNADLKITKLLLSYGANVKDSPKLLIAAVESNRTVIVEAVLEYNANVNCRGRCGATPLHFSAQKGNGLITRMLLNSGANVNAKLENGKTALHIAAEMGRKEVVKILLENGAKVDSKSEYDITPLHLGAIKGDREIIETILKFGADINSRDENGRTALHIAAHKGHPEVVTTLLEHGSDINITCRKNLTALDYGLAGVKVFYSNVYDDDYYEYNLDDYYYEYNLDDDYYEYNHYRGSCSHELTARALMSHIVKMKTANLFVSKKNVFLLSSSSLLMSTVRSQYMDDRSGGIGNLKYECKKEIARMKSEKIRNTKVSYYDILAKTTSSLAIFMRNENISKDLKSEDYKSKFPIYASMVERNFRNGMERKELLEEVNKLFHLILKNIPNFPPNCTDEIFSYLNNKDLRILMDACKPLSTNSQNTDTKM